MNGPYRAGFTVCNPGDTSGVRGFGTRMLAVGGLAAGILAGTVAIIAALASPTATLAPASAVDSTAATPHTVAFGHARIAVRVHAGGLTCFAVRLGSSTVGRSCATNLAADQIEYASSRYAVGGLAGADVHAVIVRLTRKGTVWATLRGGTFFAAVPKGYDVRAVVKVLADGSRKAFTVTGPR